VFQGEPAQSLARPLLLPGWAGDQMPLNIKGWRDACPLKASSMTARFRQFRLRSAGLRLTGGQLADARCLTGNGKPERI